PEETAADRGDEADLDARAVGVDDVGRRQVRIVVDGQLPVGRVGRGRSLEVLEAVREQVEGRQDEEEQGEGDEWDDACPSERESTLGACWRHAPSVERRRNVQRRVSTSNPLRSPTS